MSARRKPALLLAWGVAYVLALSGCSSLPRITPELARPSNEPMTIVGAKGALSAAQSKALIAKLERGAPSTDLLARHLAVEAAVVGTPLTAGNDARLLQDGPATYDAMFAALATARDHINMETYILEDDAVGQRFADLLIERQKAGVQVNLIHDGVGTVSTPTAFFDRLKAAGIAVLEFNPVNPLRAGLGWDINQRDHRKLLIVDGRVAFLGGINISSVYSRGSSGGSARFSGGGSSGGGGFSGGGASGRNAKPVTGGALGWRDTDLRLEGPVVGEFQKLFIGTWQAQKGQPLAERQYFPAPTAVGKQVVRAIGSSPDDPYSLIYVTLLTAIGSAERSVYLTNAYFVPDPQLMDALEAAVTRGVDVRLILPSQTDSWLVLQAGRAHYERLLRAGVKIYERRGAVLHSKTALIDGVWSTIGSTNLDWRSFLHNQELNAVVLGTEFGSELQKMFERDLLQSTLLTLDAWRERPLKDRVKEGFARMWEYWL